MRKWKAWPTLACRELHTTLYFLPLPIILFTITTARRDQGVENVIVLEQKKLGWLPVFKWSFS